VKIRIRMGLLGKIKTLIITHRRLFKLYIQPNIFYYPPENIKGIFLINIDVRFP